MTNPDEVRCPRCDSADVVPIRYGYPGPTTAVITAGTNGGSSPPCTNLHSPGSTPMTYRMGGSWA